MRPRRLIIRNAPLMTYLYEAILIQRFVDDVGKWNGYILVYKFSSKPGRIKYRPLYPSYKKEGKRLFLLYRDPFNPSEIWDL